MRTRLIFAVVVGLLSSVLGFMSVERSGDPVSVVKQAEKQLEEAFKPKPINSPPGAKYTNIVQIAPAWSEITKISNSLTWLNEDIFKAKALVKYIVVPEIRTIV